MNTIVIPSSLTPENLIPFSLEFNNFQETSENCLDFRFLSHVEPFGMLFLSALIRQFVRKGKENFGRDFKLTAKNYSDHDYASWMGLFKSFGLNHGNEPGQASGNGTYIPLTRLVVSKIKTEAREEYVHHGEIVEQESLRIAGVLTRHSNCAVHETLTYAIREIIRNVVEHGEASHIWYAAQYWPTKNRVEISILDEGVGLFSSLNRNSKLRIRDNRHAVFSALQPGVSGVAKEKRKKSDGDWVNSGYGLFMTSSLCQFGGSFYICSGSDAIKLIGNESEFMSCNYDGVAIRMVLDTSRIKKLNETLRELLDKGQKIASELGNYDTELTASKMSRMLSRNI
ncbi:sensor histidine kinase [Crenothrix polyspora]|uniref:Uncharacterized protein n=1 Tax=Crenothrix polyspora TaxID=360316 RepID=A0A1R4HID2_9GAMM|nr:sensor histidine kinase [Crenothrix polyspora]SJM95985.1 conserved hypothetical protein [Crenothrix polyspora]